MRRWRGAVVIEYFLRQSLKHVALMTRLAVISDIHGNSHALQAVLARLDGLAVDQVVCLGDIVGYGPNPSLCLELVVRNCDVVIQGNHEEAAIDPAAAAVFNGAAREAINWTRRAMSAAHLAALSRLPKFAQIGDHVTCVHDNPVPGPTDYIHDKEVAALAFRGVDTALCLIGHTHVPMVFEAPTLNPDETLTAPELVAYLPFDGQPIELDGECRYICNPGAVGQPRDCDPRASFGVLDLAAGTFTVHRQEYDINAAQLASHRAGLPTILADRLALGA
jgi:diadenosine tetraphosphatase ApaH/serine/threonine PP2A family protein phosphatase